MKLLRMLHRWLGFPVGLLFVITFGSGFLTAVDELLSRMDTVEAQYHSPSIKDNAKAITRFVEGHSNIRRIVMPTLATPYYEVNGRGERFLYEIGSLRELSHQKINQDGFFRTVLQLHRHFLLGGKKPLGIEGSTYVAWIGLSALVISLAGLYLWWPVRGRFRTKNILPSGMRRTHFYFSHMTGGAVTLVAVLLLALTGASIVYKDVAKQVLGVETHQKEATAPKVIKNNWQAWLSEADTHVPDGELASIRFPKQANNSGNKPNLSASKQRQQAMFQAISRATPAIVELRFVTQSDWFGLAGSKVRIDKNSSALVSAVLFSSLAVGEKIVSILVPLHTGRGLHAGYVALLLMFSLIGVSMIFSGVVSFMMKKRQWEKTLRFASVEE